MVSQSEVLTKDQSHIESYRLNRGHQADRNCATTTEASFSGPRTHVLKMDQTVAFTDSTVFLKGETRTGKKVAVPSVHKQDARIVIVARNPGPSDVLVYGDVTISFSAMEVHRRGQLVTLTRQEFRTLAYLLKNARRVISRDELLNEVWGYESYPCTRTVDNHILRLRKKLESEPARHTPIRSVQSRGHKFPP